MTFHKTICVSTIRSNIDRTNLKELKRLEDEPICVPAFNIYRGGNRKSASHALKETRLLKELQLKPNIPVILIQNLQVGRGWVNGTLVKVTDIDDENIPLVKQGQEGAEDSLWIQRISSSIAGTSHVRTQFPIVPAFATAIHKAQCITIDFVAIHLDHMNFMFNCTLQCLGCVRQMVCTFLVQIYQLELKKSLVLILIDMIDYSEEKHQRIHQIRI